MGWVPFAATVGSWLGGSAAAGGAAILAGTAAAGTAAYSATTAGQTAKAIKSTAADQAARDAAAQKAVRDAQATASSQAQAVIEQKQRRMRAGSQSIYTNPLGIGGAASVARKYLLGQ